MHATEPKHLNRWRSAQNYVGAEWDGYYSSGVGQNRDSGPLDRSNFTAMRQLLEAVSSEGLDDDGRGWVVVTENHWAVGWVEWIAIHESCADLLAAADAAAGRLADYPLLDEDAYSELEWEEAETAWRDCYCPKDRVEFLRRHLRDFAGCFRLAREAVRGTASAASELVDDFNYLMNE